MPSPSACLRCSKLLAADSDSGFCPICLIASDTSRFNSATSAGIVPSEDATTVFTATRTQRAAFAETASLNAVLDQLNTTSNLEIDFRAGLPPTPSGYDLLRRLGGGGMGDVFLAREHSTERTVAMKFLRTPGNPAAVDRFLTEVRALARIDDPRIVKVFATDFYCLVPFFTMEFVAGGTLADQVATTGPQTPMQAARIVMTVARAVDEAHAAGVLHRDLKPSNILLTEDGSPKVADFGLAKRTDRDDELTLGSAPLGTPSFMPPEQVSRQHGDVGPASDVYSLGATLYYLLSGRPPFTGDSSIEIAAKVSSDPPERLRAVRPDAPAELEAIVSKCLEKRPTHRYPTAAALADDLDRFLAGQTPAAPQLTRSRRLRRWVDHRRARLVTTVVALAIVAGVFALGAAVRPRPAPLPQQETRDPLEALQQELDSDRPVVLLGETGGPRWHRWPVGQGTLVESETRDNTIALQTHGLAFLELIDDPRHDRYQISAELRHLIGSRADSAVGIYVGRDEVAAASGASVHPMVLGGFSDVYSWAELKYGKSVHRVRLSTVSALQIPGSTAGIQRTVEQGNFLFTPCETDPKPWRTLIFNVSPEGVELFWVTEQGKTTSAGRTSSARLAADRTTVQQELVKTIGDPSRIVPDWHPRRPIGIWAFESAVSVRNVKFTPNPKSP